MQDSFAVGDDGDNLPPLRAPFKREGGEVEMDGFASLHSPFHVPGTALITAPQPPSPTEYESP